MDDYFEDDVLLANEREISYLKCVISVRDEEIRTLKNELASIHKQLKTIKIQSARTITRLCEQKYKFK